jgi:hypothetical protein
MTERTLIEGSDEHRAKLREAWMRGRRAITGLTPDAGFREWYDETYPPPLPPEPSVGSVRGGSHHGPNGSLISDVWVRAENGFWHTVWKNGHMWAAAIAAGLDPERVFVELPSGASIEHGDLVDAIKAELETHDPVFDPIHTTLGVLRKRAGA